MWGEMRSLTPRSPVWSTAAPLDGEAPEECERIVMVPPKSKLYSTPHAQPGGWCHPRPSNSFIFQQPMQLLQLKCRDIFSKHWTDRKGEKKTLNPTFCHLNTTFTWPWSSSGKFSKPSVMTWSVRLLNQCLEMQFKAGRGSGLHVRQIKRSLYYHCERSPYSCSSSSGF